MIPISDFRTKKVSYKINNAITTSALLIDIHAYYINQTEPLF